MSSVLNTMFIENANTVFIAESNMAFNNVAFNSPIIAAMHAQMTRLYAAALELQGIEGQSDVANFLNESPQTINNWEKRGISQGGLLTAQEKIGCNAIWLRDGVGAMTGGPVALPLLLSEAVDGDEVEIVQYLDQGGSMGRGLLLRDQPGEIHSWRVTTEWIEKNVKSHTGIHNLAIVTGFGDSMRGMFNPGDPLLVDRGVRAVDYDAVYFFRVGEEGFIKRLQRIPGEGLIAISENKAYRDWIIRPEMDFEVFARVIKVWHSTDF